MSFEDWTGEARKRIVSVLIPNRVFRFSKLDERLIEMTADEAETIGTWLVEMARNSRMPDLAVVEK